MLQNIVKGDELQWLLPLETKMQITNRKQILVTSGEFIAELIQIRMVLKTIFQNPTYWTKVLMII